MITTDRLRRRYQVAIAKLHNRNDYDDALASLELLASEYDNSHMSISEAIPQDMYCDLFDMLEASYWWCASYHSGQWSDEYRLLSIVGRMYTPSPLATGIDSETNIHYEALSTLYTLKEVSRYI